VLAGDFNFKPCSAQYRLLTQLEAPAAGEPDYPAPVPGLEWSPLPAQRLRSAYALAHGAEPQFTNWSWVKDTDEFLDVLDYVFVSGEVQVLDADELPARDELAGGGPLPSACQPSDHLLVAATLRV
jgi:endonuclease/exonuclease/phosphatase family metal-dependent hydrolase